MALGQENDVLKGTMGMASGMAQQGLASIGGRNLRRQMAGDTLAAQMAMAEFNARNKHAADAQEMAQAEEMLGGREAAMMDWANNVLQSYQPDSPEYKQAKRTIDMMSNRPRRGLAGNKGYLDYIEEYDINNPISQGTLGSLSVQYAGGNPKDQKPKKFKTRQGPDSELDDNE